MTVWVVLNWKLVPDIDGDSISYTIYINNTLNITTNINISIWNGSDGVYNLTMTANDSSDVSDNSSVITFTLDTTAPTFVAPKQLLIVPK